MCISSLILALIINVFGSSVGLPIFFFSNLITTFTFACLICYYSFERVRRQACFPPFYLKF
nr:MAG TPA: hypothetical protein [Caudoviricetes sp.]